MWTILFVYLFLAVPGLGRSTPVFLQMLHVGFSLGWRLLLRSAAARAKASGFLHTGFAAAWPGGSSRTRDKSRVPCFSMWLLTHCATREVWCRPCVNRPCCIYDNTASVFCFGFLAMGHVGSWFPDQGSNPHPLALEGEVLPTGPPAKSLPRLGFSYYLCWISFPRSSNWQPLGEQWIKEGVLSRGGIAAECGLITTGPEISSSAPISKG